LGKQADYLTALRSGQEGAIATAERNLRLFDFPQSAIDALRKTRAPVRSLTWSSPISGTVVEKRAIQGMRFAPGDMLYKLVDLSTIWVLADVPESQLGLIHEGGRARILFRALPGVAYEGNVRVVYPQLDMTTRTAKARIDIPNPDGRIKLGLYADVVFEPEAGEEVIAIPKSAIIDSGERQVAFVAKGDGLFEPRDLQLGRAGDEYVEVRKGIAEGETVVVAGTFLLDAESNLRAALSAFAPEVASQ
jgi:Cu(I)/Ag(I) efflux system membrane fusion protein